MKIIDCNGRMEQLKKIEAHIITNHNGRVYIWGCSQTAKTIHNFIERYSNIIVDAFVVDDEYYMMESFLNKKVLKRTEWMEKCKHGDIVVCGFVGYSKAFDLIKQLPTGVDGYYFSFPYSANAYGTWLTYDMYCQYRKEFQNVYNYLEDEFSKNVLETYINACISGNIGKLEEISMDDQYFNDLTMNYKVETFIDCGAYIGDTIEKAVRSYTQSIKKVIAFEPDEKNINSLKQRMTENEISNQLYDVVPKGSWSKKTELYFCSTGSSSAISEEGDYKIEVDSVDNIVSSMGVGVDYIKMDVEGSERESIQGAIRTIKEYTPLLAICVYHKPLDIFELMQEIQKIDSERKYTYYLRYHGPDLRELVLYAIPPRESEK